MKLRKKLIPFLVLTACLVLFCSMPVFAAELTEADVEAAVASQGTHGTGQAPSCNQKFSHHVSSGIADIDAKRCQKRINFLGYL